MHGFVDILGITPISILAIEIDCYDIVRFLARSTKRDRKLGCDSSERQPPMEALNGGDEVNRIDNIDL